MARRGLNNEQIKLRCDLFNRLGINFITFGVVLVVTRAAFGAAPQDGSGLDLSAATPPIEWVSLVAAAFILAGLVLHFMAMWFARERGK